MVSTRRNSGHVAQPRRHSRLAIINPVDRSPRHHRAVLLEGHRMETTRRNSGHVAQPRRHRRLAITIVAPRHHRAVVLEGHRMVSTRRNSGHVAQPRRHSRLALIIVTPRHHLRWQCKTRRVVRWIDRYQEIIGHGQAARIRGAHANPARPAAGGGKCQHQIRSIRDGSRHHGAVRIEHHRIRQARCGRLRITKVQGEIGHDVRRPGRYHEVRNGNSRHRWLVHQ